MKILFKIIVISSLVFLTDCAGNSKVCESVSDAYSDKLHTELEIMNADLKNELADIYAHFDVSMAEHVVLKCYQNIDSIQHRAMRLKSASFEFQNLINQLLIYPLNENALRDIELEMESYRQNLVALIYKSSIFAERRIEEINQKLIIDDYLKLQNLTQNEFKIEKELVKNKLVRVEFLVASHLLMELDLNLSFYR